MKNLLIILPYFLVFLIFFLPAVDTDLGWHLRYGEHFLDTHEVMRTNKLTYLLPGYEWQYGNLYQVLTAAIYRVGGLVALALAYGLLGTLIWLVFDLLTKKTRPLNLLIFLGAVWLGWGVFKLGWRGQIFTVFGTLLTFWMLRLVIPLPQLRAALSARAHAAVGLLLFFLLFLLWTNFHGGFVLGLFLIGGWVVDAILNAVKDLRANRVGLGIIPGLKQVQRFFARAQNDSEKVWQKTVAGVLALGVSVLASLLNPFGFDIYRESLKHATYPLNTLIAEWVAPPWQIQALVVLIAVVTIALVLASKAKRKIFWTLSVLVFTYLAVTARRNLPLFGMIVGLALLRATCQLLQLRLKDMQPRRLLSLRLLWGVGLVVMVMVIVITKVPQTVAVSTQWDKYCMAAQVKYPCEAVEWLRQNPLEAENVFNTYEWGGFLEWQLPEYKFFVDGRTPAWETNEESVFESDRGKSPYTIYLQILQTRDNYREKLEFYGTEALFIQTGTFLDLKLQQNENKNSSWLEAYRDSVAVIYRYIDR